ncbi:hypothetical protein ACFPM7_19375 [Actinokineospora guangxiensis]|uniref:Mce-associated membrane protein n=1 Tax=Actinokineospora guangxiensis TaxID=1490288 RepID=A0ABW0ES49_9PSEU
MTPKARRALGITLALAAVATLAALALTTTWRTPPPRPDDPGPAAAEQYARDYITALNTGDPTTLATLIGRAPDSPEVTTLLTTHGNRSLTDVAIRVKEEFRNVYLVWIDATTSTGEPVHLYEQLEWDRDRWWLAPPATP